jgi:hypothetical protein
MVENQLDATICEVYWLNMFQATACPSSEVPYVVVTICTPGDGHTVAQNMLSQTSYVVASSWFSTLHKWKLFICTWNDACYVKFVYKMWVVKTSDSWDLQNYYIWQTYWKTMCTIQ